MKMRKVQNGLTETKYTKVYHKEKFNLILAVILIFIDIETMCFVSWRLGLAERITCMSLLFVHTIWFFLICYFQNRKQNHVTSKHP
jgi:hypothetical protein